jgi:hypothetical protein
LRLPDLKARRSDDLVEVYDAALYRWKYFH